MSAIASRAEFNFIRYANVWEDADVLTRALDTCIGGKFLSIASAGDNSFSLLTLNPELVVAVDLNPVQLALVEMKSAAIKLLEQEEAIAFLGFAKSPNRWAVYQQLRNSLSAETKAIFDTRENEIATGIIHHGKFERYFQTFAKRILPFIHSKSTTEQLLGHKSADQQDLFYDEKWNTWRWRLLFKIFFSKPVMGRLGRDPEFLNEVKVPVGTFIFNKAERHLRSIKAQDNHMLRYQLLADFGESLPHYLRKENYPLIKSNLSALRLEKGYAEDVISKYGTFKGMNLSNIFEYMPEDIFKNTAHSLSNGLETLGRLCYWNLMVPRKLARVEKDLTHLADLSMKLSENDNGFFYQSVVVDEKNSTS